MNEVEFRLVVIWRDSVGCQVADQLAFRWGIPIGSVQLSLSQALLLIVGSKKQLCVIFVFFRSMGSGFYNCECVYCGCLSVLTVCE